MESRFGVWVRGRASLRFRFIVVAVGRVLGGKMKPDAIYMPAERKDTEIVRWEPV